MESDVPNDLLRRRLRRSVRSSSELSIQTAPSQPCSPASPASPSSPVSPTSSGAPSLEPMSPMSPKRLQHIRECKEKELEYLEFRRRLKANPPVNFQMPPDPYKGQEPAQEKILRQCKELQNKTTQNDAAYKDWVTKISKDVAERAMTKKEEERLERLRMKQQAALQAAAREEMFQQRKDAELRYRSFVDETTKAESSIPRPSSAPGGKQMWEATMKKKLEALKVEQRERNAEYEAWKKAFSNLKSSVPAPSKDILSPEQRADLMSALVKERSEKSCKVEADYWTKVKEATERAETKMKDNVAKTLAWAHDHDMMMAEERAKSRAKFKKVWADLGKEDATLNDTMLRRVRSTPLLVDETYLPPTAGFGKAFPHRRKF